jgi:WD40 repeat protein
LCVVLLTLLCRGGAARTQESRAGKERLGTLLLIERGANLCEQGQVEQGLLWLARALEEAPANAHDLRRSIRTMLSGWSRLFPAPQLLLGHAHEVHAVAFGLDGKTILTGSGPSGQLRGQAQLWDASTGKPLGAAMPHKGPVSLLRFSPDGKTFVTAGWQAGARLWDTATGKPIGQPIWGIDIGLILDVAFRPDGKAFVTGSNNGTAQQWDVSNAKPLGKSMKHKGEQVHAVAYSPDGKLILTGGSYHGARLWDAATGELLGEPLPHQGHVFAVRFSPDGKTILTGCQFEGKARLWETATRKLIAQLVHRDALNEHVTAVAFSPDGKIALTGGSDATARLWDTATGKPLAEPLVHQGAVVAVAFSPNGRRILTGSEDGTARLWETATGKAIGKPRRHQAGVVSVAFSPDGQRLATAGSYDGTARIWQAVSDDHLRLALAHGGPVTNAAFGPGGTTLWTRRGDDKAGEVRLWQIETGKPLGPAVPHHGGPGAVALGTDGKAFLLGNLDKTARIWDAATGKPLGPPLPHPHEVDAVAFAPDGKLLATGCGLNKFTIPPGIIKGEGRLWDAATGKPRGAPLATDSAVHHLAFSPDGRTLLTASWFLGKWPMSDRLAKVQLWETATGQPRGEPLVQPGRVAAAVFSPNGRAVVLANGQPMGQRWDLANGKPVPLPRHRDGVAAATFSPDGTMIVTGSSGPGRGTARLWDATSGKAIGQALPHAGAALHLAFSPDGKILLTGGSDGLARLWDVTTCKLLAPPWRHGGAIRGMAFSPNGRIALTCSVDGTARLWNVPSPLEGSAEHLTLAVQLLTAQEIDSGGELFDLDGRAYQERWQRLEQQGGLPKR